MEKQCVSCSNAFGTSVREDDIRSRVAPVIAQTPYTIPAPTQCPECRQRRRLSFRNDCHYYKNSCCFCKKQVISIYSPDKPIPVLCHECFWSDQWEGSQYGKPIDWNRSFFEQYGDMRAVVPRLAIFNTQSENSDYTVHSSRNRNCYMDSSTVGCEAVYFSDWSINSRDCSDLLMCADLELCYACINSRKCYNGDFLQLCTNVSDSLLCFDCQGSKNLMGCVSVRGKDGMILNTPATKEEVQAAILRWKTDSGYRVQFEKDYQALLLSTPKRDTWNLNVTESTGDGLMNTKGAEHSFHSSDLEDCANVFDAIRIKDACDVTRGSDGELLYECKGIIDLKMSAFCNLTYQCDRLLYCDNCHSCSNCFACFGLKRKKYCIFNTQYTQPEYEELVPKLIAKMTESGEWGEFFPMTLSAFGYNESKAQEQFPMTRDEALAKGLSWSDYQQDASGPIRMTDPATLPDDIAKIPDDILTMILSCEVTGKPYRLIPQELDFYRRKGLPVPHRCPLQRLHDRAALQNPRTLHARSCGKCSRAIESTYAPDRPEIVYCEACYLAALY